MKYKVYTAPAAEPITTAEAKTHLRVSGSDDDTYIDTLITSARESVEEFTRRALVNTTFEVAFDPGCYDPYGALVLPRSPLSSVTSVTWYDDDSDATVFSSSLYHVDTYAEPGRLVLVEGENWPLPTEVRMTNAIVVRYVAGYGAAGSAVPQSLRAAVKEWVRFLYDGDEEALKRAKAHARPFRVVML